MLMITVDTEDAIVTLRLEGRLAAPEARELERAWSAAKQPHQPMLLDLSNVTSVDAGGKAFLARAYRSGDLLIGGVATRALVGELEAAYGVEVRGSGVSGAVRDRRTEGDHALLGS